jgi:putative membrane protein
VLVVVLVRVLGDRPHQPDARPLDRNRAREVLDERYARGEIDTVEYEERRQRLENET